MSAMVKRLRNVLNNAFEEAAFEATRLMFSVATRLQMTFAGAEHAYRSHFAQTDDPNFPLEKTTRLRE